LKNSRPGLGIWCQAKFLTSAKFLILLAFISYFAAQSKGIKFGVCLFDVYCENYNFLVRCQIHTRSYSTGITMDAKK